MMLNDPLGALKPLTAQHLPLVFEWRNHPSVRAHMFSSELIDWPTHQQWYAKAQADPLRYLFLYVRNDVALGFVQFAQTQAHGAGTWGFYKAPDALRGTGFQLGQVALAHAFTVLQFHKLCAQVIASNLNSLRFHHRLGFELEGVLRQQHFDGTDYVDQHCFGLLQSQWIKRSSHAQAVSK